MDEGLVLIFGAVGRYVRNAFAIESSSPLTLQFCQVSLPRRDVVGAVSRKGDRRFQRKGDCGRRD